MGGSRTLIEIVVWAATAISCGMVAVNLLLPTRGLVRWLLIIAPLVCSVVAYLVASPTLVLADGIITAANALVLYRTLAWAPPKRRAVRT